MRGRRKRHALRKGHDCLRAVGVFSIAYAAALSPRLTYADTPAAAEATGPLQEIVVTATRH
jgi:hypothetical protein